MKNTALDAVALTLSIIGAVNWGLIGLFKFDLVAFLFGSMTLLSRIIYTIVGICGVYLISFYAIITTRPTGGLHQGYKPLLLGQRLKALAFSLDCGNSVYTAFPQLRSSHIALDSSLPLKGYCYYLALTLKRVFIFLYTQLIHCYIMLFLLLDIFFYCSLI